MPNKKSKAKQCINLAPGKIGRLVFRHTNPVYNPRVDEIEDTLNGSLTFNVLDTKWIDNSRATVRFTVTRAVPAPPPGGAPAPDDPPTDGSLSITLVDDPASGADLPVDVEPPLPVDYIDDPDDP